VDVCRRHRSASRCLSLEEEVRGTRAERAGELRQLREENAKLKSPVADLSLDRHALYGAGDRRKKVVKLRLQRELATAVNSGVTYKTAIWSKLVRWDL
jgi:hypothetical protein